MSTAAADASHMDIESVLKIARGLDAFMGTLLDERPLPANLREAARYALLGPGKRLRPVLVLQACQAVGANAKDAMIPAAAMEMIHCFSLVHDDLPAMDDDDLRRGRPTLHKHTNEAMAILAGDLLMGLAFEIIATRMPAELAAKLITELALGTNDMIAGQVHDTLPAFDPQTPPLERLQTIHKHKTGALIRCSCRMGAMVGGANAQQLQSITRYAEAIGLMFQVVDDLLDVTQTTQQLGKTAGKDVQQDKLTYPAVLGLEATSAEVRRLHTVASEALAPLGAAARPLQVLCDYMAVRDR